VRAVQQHQREFSKPPLGPIGALIDVVPAAVRAVEAALKGGGTFIDRERERGKKQHNHSRTQHSPTVKQSERDLQNIPIDSQ
jgi:hypothetical protein